MHDMTDTTPIVNTDDIIDSRDIVARIEYLRQSWADATGGNPDDYDLSADDLLAGLSEDEVSELIALESFADDAPEVSDWQYGETFIRDSYFETYARELAEDIGAVSSDASWPNYCIDWERAARDLRMDYTSYDFDGETYWARA